MKFYYKKKLYIRIRYKRFRINFKNRYKLNYSFIARK